MGFGIGGNLTVIDNIVKNSPYSVIPSGSASGSGLTSATINGYINNQPIGTFYLLEYTGIGSDGLSVYRDVDKDGIISDKDRVALGTALPKTMYNFYGNFDFNVYAGKTFGTLPYTFLDIAPGNELHYYNKYAFSLMNKYEFVHDKFAGISFEHNIGNGIFRFIPKLKFRQFYTIKTLWGSARESGRG